jgi:tetratricopeptide (TPR) repeat protein
VTTIRPFVLTLALRALVALSLITSLAWAAPKEPPAVTEARVLYQQGVSAYDKGDYPQAEKLLRDSYAKHPHPATLRNLAAVLERLERRADACNELARMVRVHPDSQERANAERTLQNLSQRVGRIEVEVSIAGADIKVDDTWAGVSPLPQALVRQARRTHDQRLKAGFKRQLSGQRGGQCGGAVSLKLRPEGRHARRGSRQHGHGHRQQA